MASYLTEELARALFAESQDALFLFDPNTDKLLDANPAALKLTGFGPDEVVQLPATELFRVETGESQDRLRGAAERTAHFHSQEGFSLRTKRTGVWVPVNITVTRLHLSTGTLGLLAARDIRQQRAAHSKLQQIEAELRRVLGSVSDCVWSAAIAADGKISYRYYSPVVETITGRPTGHYLPGPERWAEIIRPEDRERWQAALDRVKRGESAHEEHEYRITRPDGTLRWVRDSVKLTRDASGRPARLDAIVTDITERKRVEQALMTERYFLHALLDNVPDTIYFKDSQSRFLRASKALALKFGLNDPAETAGKTDFDFFTDEHAAPAFADEQEVMKTGVPIVGKEELETWPDGHITWASTTKVPLCDRSGRVIGTFGISRDITARKLAEQALAAERNTLRTLIDHLPDLIYFKDRECRYVADNLAHAQFLGATEPGQVTGKTVFDFFPKEVADRFQGDDQAVIGAVL